MRRRDCSAYPGEQCDDGNTVTETCVYGDQTCTVCNQACQEQTLTGTYCGDGVVQDTEVCDDGNDNDGDYCSADCQSQTSVCGDSLIQGNEACDDEISSSRIAAMARESAQSAVMRVRWLTALSHIVVMAFEMAMKHAMTEIS